MKRLAVLAVAMATITLGGTAAVGALEAMPGRGAPPHLRAQATPSGGSTHALRYRTTRETPVRLDLIPEPPAVGDWDILLESVPMNGALTGTLPNLVYTPRKGFTGTDGFRYRLLSDSEGERTVRVDIQVDDREAEPPVADPDASRPRPPSDPPAAPPHGPGTDAGRVAEGNADAEAEPRPPVPPAASESRQPAAPKPATPSAPAVPSTGFAVQVLSVKTPSDADAAVRSLSQEGHAAFHRRAVVPGRGPWYRVYVGPFPTMADARTGASALRKTGFPDAFPTQIGDRRPSEGAGQKRPPIQAGKGEAPYAYQVRSFEERGEALELARRLRGKGRTAFVGQATARGGKVWHRVYVGAYRSPSVADPDRVLLGEDGLTGIFLVYLPYCVEISNLKTRTDLSGAESRLAASGFFPYRLASAPDGPGERLVVGGFYKKRDAQALVGWLRGKGFDAALARR